MEIEQSNEVEYGNNAELTGEVTTRWEVTRTETILKDITFLRSRRDPADYPKPQTEEDLAKIIGDEPAQSMLEFQKKNAESDFNALEPQDGKDRPDETQNPT